MGQPLGELGPNTFAIGAGVALTLSALRGCRKEMISGEKIGWRSKAYGSKIEAPVLKVSWEAQVPTTIATVIDCQATHSGGHLVETETGQWRYQRDSLQVELEL